MGAILAFSVEGHLRNLEELSFKGFYFYLWRPFYSAERNHFTNFRRGSLNKHFCDRSIGLGGECHLNVFFSIYNSGSHLVQETFL